MTKWHKGPPPSIGWWPASVNRDENILRWWNGQYWSRALRSNDSIEIVEKFANVRTITHIPIEWTDRPSTWPERSRTCQNFVKTVNFIITLTGP
jgi:hypothetical protein